MRPPPELVVPRVRTGRGGGVDGPVSWIHSRFEALRALGVPSDAAAAAVAHAAHETGFGRAEWNFNFGNYRWFAPPEKAMYLRGSDDPEGGAPYRAHASLAAGARSFLYELSHFRYADAWRWLLGGGDGREWYARICRAGWHPYSDASTRSYSQQLGRVRTVLGLPALAGPPPSHPEWERRGTSSSGRARPGALVAILALAALVLAARAR